MSEMVDRVAEALAPFFSAADRAYGEPGKAARAAIEAMSPPTEAMIEATARAFDYTADVPDANSWRCYLGEARQAYTAMINTALKD